MGDDDAVEFARQYQVGDDVEKGDHAQDKEPRAAEGLVDQPAQG